MVMNLNFPSFASGDNPTLIPTNPLIINTGSDRMTLLDIRKLNEMSECPGYLASDCGGFQVGRYGEIDAMGSETSCRWTFAVEYGRAVEIVFNDFTVLVMTYDKINISI